jgi:hypothetical protein
MDLVCDAADAIGEFSGVRDDLVGSVVAAVFDRPAVIDCGVLDGS